MRINKKVLFADTYYPPSHRHMEETTFYNLADVCDLYIMAPEEWYSHIPINTHIVNAKNYFEIAKKSTFKRLIVGVKNLINIRHIVKCNKIDTLVLGEFENYILPIYTFLLPRKLKVLYMYHNNIDLMRKNRFQRAAFSIVKSNMNHIVLDEFIGEKLITAYKIKKEKIFCWPHPIYELREPKVRKYDCVGISQSNDEKIIGAIIADEEQYEKIKKSNLKVVLRSKKYHYDNGYLKVINGWLSDEEYQDYLDNAKCVLIPFPVGTFQYRPSGTVIDAFSRKISVLGSDIELIKKYSQTYSQICKIFHLSTFAEDVMDICRSGTETLDFDRFLEFHSNDNIKKAMVESLR